MIIQMMFWRKAFVHAGTWRLSNFCFQVDAMPWPLYNDVASTSLRRCINVMCPLRLHHHFFTLSFNSFIQNFVVYFSSCRYFPNRLIQEPLINLCEHLTGPSSIKTEPESLHSWQHAAILYMWPPKYSKQLRHPSRHETLASLGSHAYSKSPIVFVTCKQVIITVKVVTIRTACKIKRTDFRNWTFVDGKYYR